jgi:MFS family permease
MAFMMPVAGKLYDKFGPRWPSVIGLCIATAGGFMLCGISPDMTEGDVISWTCLRAVGNGLAMMPIFTAGLASIPQEYISSGSPANNIAQRASGALGLAIMTALFTEQQAQMWANQGALVTEHGGPPLVGQLTEQGLPALFGYYQVLQVHVAAQAMSDMFLVAAWLTAAGIVLAFFMHSGANTGLEAEPAAQPDLPGAPGVRGQALPRIADAGDRVPAPV